jgi:tRNA (guanine-N7-)-methyltransferase
MNESSTPKEQEKRPKEKTLGKTKELPKPNPYAVMLMTTYSDKAFDEDIAHKYKGVWRKEIFSQGPDYSLDLEIGTGNGYHFAHRSSQNTDRGLLGIEVKYKPLIQAIRRALKAGANDNAYMIRYDAAKLTELFTKNEINNVYIHHPDPWPKKKQWKHRLIQDGFLRDLHGIMRAGSFVEFKTDDESYYDWSLDVFNRSEFKVEFHSKDLHNSKVASENFITHFESIFLKKGQPIFYLKAFKETDNKKAKDES